MANLKYEFDKCPVCGGERYGYPDGHYMLCKTITCPMFYFPVHKALTTPEQVLTYNSWITDDGHEWFNPIRARVRRMMERDNVLCGSKKSEEQ